MPKLPKPPQATPRIFFSYPIHHNQFNATTHLLALLLCTTLIADLLLLCTLIFNMRIKRRGYGLLYHHEQGLWCVCGLISRCHDRVAASCVSKVYHNRKYASHVWYRCMYASMFAKGEGYVCVKTGPNVKWCLLFFFVDMQRCARTEKGVPGIHQRLCGVSSYTPSSPLSPHTPPFSHFSLPRPFPSTYPPFPYTLAHVIIHTTYSHVSCMCMYMCVCVGLMAACEDKSNGYALMGMCVVRVFWV